MARTRAGSSADARIRVRAWSTESCRWAAMSARSDSRTRCAWAWDRSFVVRSHMGTRAKSTPATRAAPMRPPRSRMMGGLSREATMTTPRLSSTIPPKTAPMKRNDRQELTFRLWLHTSEIPETIVMIDPMSRQSSVFVAFRIVPMIAPTIRATPATSKRLRDTCAARSSRSRTRPGLSVSAPLRSGESSGTVTHSHR